MIAVRMLRSTAFGALLLALPLAAVVATAEPSAAMHTRSVAEPMALATATPAPTSSLHATGMQAMPAPSPDAASSVMPLPLSPRAVITSDSGILTNAVSEPLLPIVSTEPRPADAGQLFVEQRPDALISGATLSIVAGTDRQTAAEGSAAALLAEIIMQTPVEIDGVKTPLLQAATDRGATLVANLNGDRASFTIQARGPRLAELLDGLRQAIAAPAFTASELVPAKARLQTQIANQSQNPLAVGMTTYRSGVYRDSSQAWPFFGTKADVTAARLSQLREFYHRAYVREGTNLALVGTISPNIRDAGQALLDAFRPGASVPIPVRGWKPFPVGSLVLGEASLYNPVFVIGYPAPAMTSPDFGAIYIVMTLFQVGTGFDNVTTSMNPAYKAVHVVYDYNSQPANLTVTMTSPGESSETAARAILTWIEVLSTREMDAPTLQAAKNLAIGRYLNESFEPNDESLRIVTFASLGLGANGPSDIIRRINEVAPADLQRVVEKYCAKATYARVTPRSDSTP